MGKTFRFNPDKAKKAYQRVNRARKQKKANGHYIEEQFAPVNHDRKNLAPYWQAEFDGGSARPEGP